MPLSRLTNYVDGNVLTGAQLNNEFDNILNNGPSLVSAAIPSYSAVSGLTGSIISNVGSFQANAYQLKSTTTITSLSATSSFSVNTQTAGPIAGGRDQAAVFGSTDVHFYAITTGGTSTNAAGICSTKPPSIGPTLPAGYLAWAYLASAKYSTGSSAANVASDGVFVQGSRVIYVNPLSNNWVFGTGGANTTDTVVSASTWVPLVASQFAVNIYGLQTQTAAAGTSVSGAHAFSVQSGFPMAELYSGGNASTALGRSAYVSAIFTLPVLTSSTPNMRYQHSYVAATSATFSANILGYIVPNGDVG